MKRTTIYLEPELEMQLKLRARRSRRPMAEIIRESLRAYLQQDPQQPPPAAGKFDSGHRDTAERAEEILEETGFGED